MIYNTELTNKLIEFYGEDVINWAKSNIRWKLEEGVSATRRLILDPDYLSIKNNTYNIYQDIKKVDDEFTEYYTKELN